MEHLYSTYPGIFLDCNHKEQEFFYDWLEAER